MKGAKTALLVGVLLLAAVSAYGDTEWATFEIKAQVSQEANPGNIVPVSIDLARCDQDFGGFDLYLQFDPAILSVDHVEKGQILLDCGWQYFMYRSDVGSGLVRIVALADSDSEPGQPTCFAGTGTLAVVYFEVDPSVTGDRLEPIKFFWQDCGDNALSNISMDTLYISDNVFDWDGTVVTGEAGTGGASLDCIPGPPDRVVVQWIEFTHGGANLVCPPPADGCDPNGNGTPWEMTDLAFLVNYLFMAGPIPSPFEIGDCDCNSSINILDITRAINYMFRGGDNPWRP